jgi:hypothetical protein
VTALFLAAMTVVVLAVPFGLRTAVAQDDLSIQTRVQILHAGPDVGQVEVHINNDEVLDEFDYGEMSDWIDIDPGSSRLTITQDRAGFNYAIFDAMYPVPAGNDYLVIITDSIIMTSAVDRTPVPDGGARVRIAHAAVDLPAVNVNASGANVSFATQLAYPRSSEYQVVPAGTYDLEVTLADTGDSVLTMPGVVLEGNMVYELVIMGQPDDDDKPLEIRSLVDTTTEQAEATPTG